MKRRIYKSSALSLKAKSIRLLTISPSSDRAAPISCNLTQSNLDDAPIYRALSYVWGSDSEQRVVTLNGLDIKVTLNLHEALTHIRSSTEPLTFWIDALCINQYDLDERAHQVRIMGDIYKHAKDVWCWLGCAEMGDDRILYDLYTTHMDSMVQNKFENDIFSEVRPEDCRALISLCRSRYWQRTWTLQEFALATNIIVLFGDNRFPSQFFEKLQIRLIQQWAKHTLNMPEQRFVDTWRSLLFPVYNTFDHSIASFLQTRHRVHNISLKKNPLDVLYYHRRLHATDPRDKIYGCLAIFEAMNPTDVRRAVVDINYSKPYTKIYRDYTQLYITSNDSLEIIQHAAPEQSVETWVPNWAKEGPANVPMHWEYYNATPKARCNLSASFKSSSMHVKGIDCGGIISFNLDAHKHFRFETLLFTRCGCTYPTGIPLLQAVFRTLIQDNYHTSSCRLDQETDSTFYRLVIGFLSMIFDSDTINTALREYIAPLAEDDESDQAKDTSGTDPLMEACRTWCYTIEYGLNSFLKQGTIPSLNGIGRMYPKTEHEEAFEDRIQDAAPMLDWLTELHYVSRAETPAAIVNILFEGENSSRYVNPAVNLSREEVDSYQQKYAYSSSASSHGMALFMMQRGYFGLGPETLQAGDCVCVLYGGRVPFVLRPTDDHHRLIGPCFVLGLMDGEALDWLDRGEARETVFDLQ